MTKDEEMFVRRKATGCFFYDIFTFVSAKTKLNVCFSKCLRGTTATSTQGIKHSLSINEKKREMYLFLHFLEWTG